MEGISNLNAANVLVLLGTKFLVIEQDRGCWALPGGGCERRETMKTAASREASEEMGVSIPESKMRLAGLFVQLHPELSPPQAGLLGLYLAEDFSFFINEEKHWASEFLKSHSFEELVSQLSLQDEEVVSAKFMTFREIIKEKKKFGLAYIRMIVHAWNFLKASKKDVKTEPIEAALSTPVFITGVQI